MNEHKSQVSRRRFLGASGAALAGAAGLSSGNSEPLFAGSAAQARSRALRVGHLTDVHVQPERGATQGMVAALRSAQSLADPPELILTGGDSIMDALAVGSDRLDVQWRLWQRVIADECSLPVESCIGNHDVWGWNRAGSGTSGKESGWGKRRALDEFGIEAPYRSFDRAGWHVIILDSIFPDEETVYQGRLDDEQFDWLIADLKGVDGKKPVLVVSHIPILTVAAVEFQDQIQASPSRSRMSSHQDAKRIVDLFKRHSNVKLCLSGHLHLTEQIEYAGVTYVCGGAVSGNWWKGNHHGTEEGYTIADLYDDGSFEWHYVDYEWSPPA